MGRVRQPQRRSRWDLHQSATGRELAIRMGGSLPPVLQRRRGRQDHLPRRAAPIGPAPFGRRQAPSRRSPRTGRLLAAPHPRLADSMLARRSRAQRRAPASDRRPRRGAPSTQRGSRAWPTRDGCAERSVRSLRRANRRLGAGTSRARRAGFARWARLPRPLPPAAVAHRATRAELGEWMAGVGAVERALLGGRFDG